jgi:hypothetical protein
LYVWGTARDANENQSHYRPQMIIIIICNDQKYFFGRALVLASGG